MRLIQRASAWFLVDRFEVWSWLRFLRWNPDSDAALLIGVPLSPLGRAEKKLSSNSIPYVLDLGDLSVIGVPKPGVHGIGRYRAKRLERRLIRNAAGIVVTAEYQAQVAGAIAPSTPILTRPNGYRPVNTASIDWSPRPPNRNLRIFHLGLLSHTRIDTHPFFTNLADSQRWDSVTLVQLGDVKRQALNHLPDRVEVEAHPSMPLDQAYALAARCDIALVIDNWPGTSLPSKAIQYLTLPLPRLALVHSLDSELAGWVGQRPGWTTVEWDGDNAAQRLVAVIEDNWAVESMVPPPSESWTVVADDISAFITSVLDANPITI